MPKIPKLQRSEKPQVIEGVRISPGAMTQESQAMAQAGEALSAVGGEFVQRMREAREASEAANTEVALATKHSELARTAEMTPFDPKNPTGIADAYRKGMEESSNGLLSEMTEERAIQAVKRNYAGNSVSWNSSIQSISDKKQISFFKASLDARTEERIKNVDPLKPHITINAGLADIEAQYAAGTIPNREAADQRKADFREKISEQVVWTIANNLGFEAGIKWLNNPTNTKGVKASMVSSMQAKLRTQWGLQRSMEIDKENEYIESWENQMFQDSINNQLDIERINDLSIPVSKREHWKAIMDTKAEAALSGKDDPTAITSPETKAETIRLLAENPFKALKYIDGKHGKGLSTDDTLKYRDKALSKKATVLKLAVGMLTDAEKEEILDSKQYAEAMIELDRRATEEDATPERAIEIADEILNPFKESWYGRILDFFTERQISPADFSSFGIGDVTGKKKKDTRMSEMEARKALADKKITGDEQDKWIEKYKKAGVIK